MVGQSNHPMYEEGLTSEFRTWLQSLKIPHNNECTLYHPYYLLSAFVLEVERDAANNGPVPHDDISKRDIGEALYRLVRDFGLEDRRILTDVSQDIGGG